MKFHCELYLAKSSDKENHGYANGDEEEVEDDSASNNSAPSEVTAAEKEVLDFTNIKVVSLLDCTTMDELGSIINEPRSFLPPSLWVFMIFFPVNEADAHLLSLEFPKNPCNNPKGSEKKR